MGGNQGSNGYLKIFGIGPGFYAKGSFWDKWVVEPFSGTHDQLNSFTAYDSVNDPNYNTYQFDIQGNQVLRNGSPVDVLVPRIVGNIRPDYGWMASIMNAVDIPLSMPFALATIANQLPPGTLQIIIDGLRAKGLQQGDKP
jgi:hypothetical protein